MKKQTKVLIITLMLIGLVLTGCQNTSIDTGGTGSNDKVEDNKKDEDTNQDQDRSKEDEAAAKIREREELERDRKTLLGEFYVPLVALGSEREKNRVEAKGLYVTGNVAASTVNKDDVALYAEYIEALKTNDLEKIATLKPQLKRVNKFEKIIGIAVATEINTFVIDVKDDYGLMTYKSNIESVENANGNRKVRIKDVKALMELLKSYDIYTIGRIVTFKDRNLASEKPEHAIQLKSGGVWKDNKDVPWVNPFDKYVWDYNVAIAKEAALMGFEEIQFDYVRFPENAKIYNKVAAFPGRDSRDKDEAIEQFLNYAHKELEGYQMNTSADVFGVITKSWDDSPEDIGQTWRKIGRNVEYMSPMIYPSHYGTGWYGLDIPDAYPYEVLKGALEEAIERNAALEEPPVIRPWIQGFTATWVKGYIRYGVEEIREQIIAGKELGVHQYLIWNPTNTYDPLAYVPGEGEKDIVTYDHTDKNKDLLNQTPEEVIKAYLKGEQRDNYPTLYLLTPLEERQSSYNSFQVEMEKRNYNLIDYEVLGSNSIDENHSEVLLSYQYRLKNGEDETIVQKDQEKWMLVKENGVWKVRKPSMKENEIIEE